MTLHRTVATTLSNAARLYRRYRTHRILESLPVEIRKDIGYADGRREW